MFLQSFRKEPSHVELFDEKLGLVCHIGIRSGWGLGTNLYNHDGSHHSDRCDAAGCQRSNPEGNTKSQHGHFGAHRAFSRSPSRAGGERCEKSGDVKQHHQRPFEECNCHHVR